MLELSPQPNLTPEVAPEKSSTMTVSVEGDIGRDEMAEIGDMLFRLAHRGVTQIVLDLTDVSHFDYRGVRPLLARAELFRRAGGDIKLSGLSPYVHAIFRSAGANDAFDYFASSELAIDAFAKLKTVAD